MNTAASLLGSSTTIFWLTVVLVVLGLATVIVPLVLWLRGAPRRRITCSVISRSPLLTAPEGMREELRLRYRNKLVQNPYVVSFQLENTGRSAIPSSLFDQNRGLILNMSAPIIKILAVERKPSSAPEPELVPTGGKLELKPELIVAKETIDVSILTEGRVEDVELSLSPFGDVTVQVLDRETQLHQRSQRRTATLIAFATIVTLAALVATILNAARLQHVNSQPQLSSLQMASAHEHYAILSWCQLLKDGNAEAAASIGHAYQIAKKATSDGMKRRLLDAPEYKAAVANARLGVDDLKYVYSAAARSGLRLGNASQVPTMSTEAVSILQNLPSKVTRTKAIKDLAIVRATLNHLSSATTVPRRCQT